MNRYLLSSFQERVILIYLDLLSFTFFKKWMSSRLSRFAPGKTKIPPFRWQEAHKQFMYPASFISGHRDSYSLKSCCPLVTKSSLLRLLRREHGGMWDLGLSQLQSNKKCRPKCSCPPWHFPARLWLAVPVAPLSDWLREADGGGGWWALRGVQTVRAVSQFMQILWWGEWGPALDPNTETERPSQAPHTQTEARLGLRWGESGESLLLEIVRAGVERCRLLVIQEKIFSSRSPVKFGNYFKDQLQIWNKWWVSSFVIH